MFKKYYIGIDIGTTFLKVSIFDFKLKKVCSISKELNLICKNEYELYQEPDSFLSKTIEGIKECIKASNVDSKMICSLSIDSQMGGIMTIDKDFNPVTNYEILHDPAARKYSDLLNIENGDAVYEETGCLSAYGGKILFLLNDKNYSKKIRRFIQPAGFVVGKLCNLNYEDAFMDYTYLCWSGLADGRKLEWSIPLCKKFNVDMERLPRIVDPFSIAGYLTDKMAKICNLKSGIPVASGAGDSSVTLFGAGINSVSQAALLLGTACGIFFSQDKINLLKKYKYPNQYSVFRDIRFLQNWDLSGRSHYWYIDTFFKGSDKKNIFRKMDKYVSNIEIGSNNLFFIPFFNGIMQPYKPYFRGGWHGLNLSHTKYHMYRSILESIAYNRYLDFLNIMDFLNLNKNALKKVVFIGGGARSDLWAQIFSDLFNLEIIRYKESHDFACFGSAVIAASSICDIDNPKDFIANFLRIEKVFYPNSINNKTYKRLAGLYKYLIKSVDSFYQASDKN